MLPPDWPRLPIWPDDLPTLRDLMTEEEYAELLERTRLRAAAENAPASRPEPAPQE
jgi:hypothetical protein